MRCAGLLLLLVGLLGNDVKADQQAIDIVQVDVGTKRTFSGVLNLPATLEVIAPHGEEMATALQDELTEHGAGPVFARQTVWHYGKESPTGAIWEAILFSPKIISMSFGGQERIDSEEKALRFADAHGILLVASAGNRHQLENTKTNFPGALKLPCMVSVGTTLNGERVETSREGEVWLHRYPNEYGTSYSAARIAGLALVLWRKHPEANCAQVKELLKEETRGEKR